MKLKQIFIIAFLVNCCLLLPSLIASQNLTDIDRLLARGDSLLAQKKLEEAGEAFKAALKIDRDLIQAYAGLGKIAIAQEKWGDASDKFGKVLDRDPENIEANYFEGICFRETGKFKALLLRKLDWNKSKKHFIRVLDRDSLFMDVVYQFARLERYKEKYKEDYS